MQNQPPVAVIESGNGSAVKERQAVKIGQGLGNIVVLTIHLTNPVHGQTLPKLEL